MPKDRFLGVLCLCCFVADSCNLNQFHIVKLAEILMSRVGSVLRPDSGLHKTFSLVYGREQQR